MTILGVDDFVQSLQSLIETDNIVQNFFVNLVSVLQLAKIDTLCRTNNFDFGRIYALVCQSLFELSNVATYESLHRQRI